MSELLHRTLKQVISYNNRFDINNLFFKCGILGHNDITEVGVNFNVFSKHVHETPDYLQCR